MLQCRLTTKYCYVVIISQNSLRKSSEQIILIFFLVTEKKQRPEEWMKKTNDTEVKKYLLYELVVPEEKCILKIKYSISWIFLCIPKALWNIWIYHLLTIHTTDFFFSGSEFDKPTMILDKDFSVYKSPFWKSSYVAISKCILPWYWGSQWLVFVWRNLSWSGEIKNKKLIKIEKFSMYGISEFCIFPALLIFSTCCIHRKNVVWLLLIQ